MSLTAHPFHDRFQLNGEHVTLLALQHGHAHDLHTAASENRASYSLTLVPATLADMQIYVDRALQEREQSLTLPFAIFSKALDRIVGTTRFGWIEYWSWPDSNALQRAKPLPDAAEIGWTWLASSSQRTPINSEMKFLMLQFAFEEWKLHRVTFRTDSRNHKSRLAIERLGAKLDGVLRSNMPAYDGVIRDTAFYSILRTEWDTQIRKQLMSTLVKYAR